MILGTYVLSVFAVALAGTLVAGYAFVNGITETQHSLDEIFRGDFLWLLVAVSAAITLGVCGLLLFIETRLSDWKVPFHEHDRKDHNLFSLTDSSDPDSDLTSRLLRLNRYAERLRNVEQDLIRSISENYEIDLPTRRLLTEMQVCTNRLLGQLSAIDRSEPAAISSEERRSREPHEVC